MPTVVPQNVSGHPMPVDILKIPIGISAVNTEVDTGYDIPATGLILEAWVEVITAEATGGTKTLDLGLLSSESGGDADGFVDGVSVASTGIKPLTLISSGQTRGALLRADESGAGVLVPVPFSCASVTAKSVSRTLGSNDWVEFVGNLILLYAAPVGA
jgi:hypothetical protein